MIDESVYELVDYAVENELISEIDRRYAVNMLFSKIRREWVKRPPNTRKRPLADILADFSDYGETALSVDKSPLGRDMYDTGIMGLLTPFPHEVNSKFWEKYNSSPRAATDWFYKFNFATNYIRADRLARDMKWTTETEFGDLQITINLAKPEKDPRAIAAAARTEGEKYPLCQLCPENEGYQGRDDHPARQNLRIISMKIGGEDWGFQYSPYVYYNEHCIVLSMEHRPMCIDKAAFLRLFDFLRQFPHYFIGSNADLPIVGGSILSHDHFQGGRHEMPMARAGIREKLCFTGFEDISAGIVRWPMSVIRLCGRDSGRLAELAAKILDAWRGYSDESVDILSQSGGEMHNTITPIARRRGEDYEIDLVLRNNRTTAERPLGIFHPAPDKHHIKKENIGLIEVMGLAILPPRLLGDIEGLAEAILHNKDILEADRLWAHKAWLDELLLKYQHISSDNVMDVLKYEIGLVFLEVLKDAGVFKDDEKGREAFLRFCEKICG